MAYAQDLYKIVTPIPKPKLKRLNRSKKWEYGYNKDHDVVIISKDGTIGEIYNIQGLVIALPKAPKVINSSGKDAVDQRWTAFTEPKELERIKSIFEWENQPTVFKDKWFPHIDQQFEYREKGYWFMNIYV